MGGRDLLDQGRVRNLGECTVVEGADPEVRVARDITVKVLLVTRVIVGSPQSL